MQGLSLKSLKHHVALQVIIRMMIVMFLRIRIAMIMEMLMTIIVLMTSSPQPLAIIMVGGMAFVAAYIGRSV